MSGTGFLNNNGASLVDPAPYYAVDTNDRPWDLAFSGVYGLPFGEGGAWLATSGAALKAVVSNWQLEWIFQNDGGTPVGYPNTENFNCGSYDILPLHKSYKSYLNNSQHSCFSTFTPYTATTRLPVTTVLRNPWAQQTALGMTRKFVIRDGTTLQFKAEAFNLTNTPIFGAPSTGSPDQEITRNTSVAAEDQPGSWSGYGTIGSTEQNFPRQIQLSLKVQF
jgi:hypothetical protein